MNLRNQVKNIVLNKTQNNSFTGYFGDYIYQKEGKNAGEFFHKQDNKYISIYDVLTKEGLYDSKDQFDLGLSSSGIDVQPLKLSDFAEAPKVIDIFNIINDAYTSKNKQVKEVTGSSGGLRVEKSGSKIKLYEGGTLLKTFKFNPGTGSEDFIKSVDGQKLLQELINNVNGSLNPNFVDDKYNIG